MAVIAVAGAEEASGPATAGRSVPGTMAAEATEEPALALGAPALPPFRGQTALAVHERMHWRTCRDRCSTNRRAKSTWVTIDYRDHAQVHSDLIAIDPTLTAT